MTGVFLTASQSSASHLPSRVAPVKDSSSTESGIIALIITGAIVIGVISMIGYKRYQRYRFRWRIQTSTRMWWQPYRKYLDAQSSEHIPCRECQFFKDNHYLRCAIHPSIVMTKQSINCLDYQSYKQ